MKRIKVKYKKLGKFKAWGMANYDDNTIEVDSNLKAKKKMEIILHECLHCLFKDMDEEDVIKNSVILTNTLWHENFRSIEPEQKIPLQDGTK
jgi:hypothetical protein